MRRAYWRLKTKREENLMKLFAFIHVSRVVTILMQVVNLKLAQLC